MQQCNALAFVRNMKAVRSKILLCLPYANALLLPMMAHAKQILTWHIPYHQPHWDHREVMHDVQC